MTRERFVFYGNRAELVDQLLAISPGMASSTAEQIVDSLAKNGRMVIQRERVPLPYGISADQADLWRRVEIAMQRPKFEDPELS